MYLVWCLFFTIGAYFVVSIPALCTKHPAFHYELTECDPSIHRRWRVAIPEDANTTLCPETAYPQPRELNGCGVKSETKCELCPPGTFAAGVGAKECQDCPINTFTKGTGSKECIPCDNVTSYAPARSGSCLPRPACTENDFYEKHSPCSLNRTLVVAYEWMLPKICRDDLPESVSLPETETRKCPPCNPGMIMGAEGKCTFCGKNEFARDGTCHPCSKNTVPLSSYELVWWNDISASAVNLSTACIQEDVEAQDVEVCSDGVTGWSVAEDRIQTVHGLEDDSLLILNLFVPGFLGVGHLGPNGLPQAIGKLVFDFELYCPLTQCELTLWQITPSRGDMALHTWTGTQSRRSFTQPIFIDEPHTFSWGFQRTSSPDSNHSHRWRNVVARIFSINVTNVIGGGASQCVPCYTRPQESLDRSGVGGGCLPCPSGHVRRQNGTSSNYTCVLCPEGTVANPTAEDCVGCGPGLKSNAERTRCDTDCTLTDRESGLMFDFSDIPSSSAHSAPWFTEPGVEYLNQFNISLCGKPSLASCTDTSNMVARDREPATYKVEAFVCRSVMLKSKAIPDVTATLSAACGDHLVAISTASSFQEIRIPKSFETPPEEEIPRVNFFYVTTDHSKHCSYGVNVTLTLACDRTESAAGRSCVLRVLAMDVLSTFFGVLQVHVLDANPKITHAFLQFLIVMAVSAALCLLVCLLGLYKRTRQIEYKYMSLVQATGRQQGSGNDSTAALPAPETCALGEEEEEDEEVHFSKGLRFKSPGMFRRLLSAFERSESTERLESTPWSHETAMPT
ncbi:unnamed protein product [Cyprideis torosa]|uniref:Tyrosine-protein kinase ephrin type A/B receptor-like domain-containing protein n=1 Tax=Cyprideis torosa TaxID=163714 RepID=A0A7R8W2M2_9CRUS|nr:unnamed protein product [Cyprideis torosa]CAG0881183.1 unnamed protein product [Cyprideis torosa]